MATDDLVRGVVFTQFLYPRGERKPVRIDGLPTEVEELARELQAGGWRFEIECNPRTGIVHADVSHDEGPLANTLVENGTGVPAAIERMIREAHAAWVRHGRVRAELFELKLLVDEAAELADPLAALAVRGLVQVKP